MVRRCLENKALTYNDEVYCIHDSRITQYRWRALECGKMLLLSTTTTTTATIGSCLHYSARGLLQRSFHGIAKVHIWHFKACAECSSDRLVTNTRKYAWPWPVESTSWPVTLVQRLRANRVQDRCHGSPRSREQSADLLERPMDSIRSSSSTADIYYHQSASSDCSANYICPSSFICYGLDGLELTTDWVSWSVCRF